MSQRGLKNDDSFELLTRALMKDFPDSIWAEDALNNLVTYYIAGEIRRGDRSDRPRAVPALSRGAATPSAPAWKAGWFAYRSGNMREAAEYFESGGRDVSAVGLPAGVSCTGRAARATRRGTGQAPWPVSAGDGRLPEHVLRQLAATGLKRLRGRPGAEP